LVSCPEKKRAMIKKSEELSVSRQCELLKLPRSTAYHKPTGPNAQDLALMRVIDEVYQEFPYFGSRQMRRLLCRLGHSVGRRRVRRLMHLMGLEALCPKPNLSKPAPGHKIYAYLMKSVAVIRPNQAWCADITYIRLSGGFVYLVAIMDWYSRKILSWRLSNTMDSSFCVEALSEAIAKNGAPEIMNTDQGSQFTGENWIGVLKSANVKISMDGKGRAIDNVFIERFWRSLKYEEVYRREYEGVADAREHLRGYINRYNQIRPHSQLNDRTPEVAYREKIAPKAA
jgi:putative transposase